jgi:DNA-binding SARP family transcriptional activator/tetratricopeptide (TPR) repeat protein
VTAVDLGLLGGFEVTVDGVPVPAARWTRRHATALVKLLALAPGRRLHREQVLDLLWPGEAPEDALPKLHKAAHFARRALAVPDAVVLRRETVLLCPDTPVGVDVDRFEELARTALGGGDTAAALAAYPGELLPHDRYEPWAQQRREELRLRHRELLRLDGAWTELLEVDPADEVAHLALMQRHADAGDHLAALRQFDRLARTLHRELGVAPGPEATALRDRILAERSARPRRAGTVIGRDRELALVDDAVRAVAGGRARTLIVTGPAGMGKSALVETAVERAAGRGLRVGTGTSAAMEGAWPYAPVLEALAELCRADPGLLDDLGTAQRTAIERALTGADTDWDGAGSHQRLFGAAADLVAAAAAGRGVLLAVEDLHDADESSLRLLHHLVRVGHGRAVGVVVSHRPDPMPDALVAWRRSLLDRHGAVEVPLRPLAAPDVARLVGRHVAAPDAQLLGRIEALGRGIPFAVHELARRAAAGTPLQATLVGVAGETRDVLQRVAVAGSAFDTDEFVALSGLAEHEAFDHLDAALTALVVEPVVDGTAAGYRFRHALLREALLADLPEHRRRSVHRDAATRLVGLDASPARIGHHLMAAGMGPQAVPHLLRAARTQAAVGAYGEALALLDALWPHATRHERGAAMMLRGDLQNALGDPAAIATYREALVHAPREAQRALRVRLAHAAMLAGDLPTAAAALDGLDPDGGDGDADLLLTRGKCAYFVGDFATAQAAADAAQRLVLAGASSWKVLDLVTLQGMLAHRTGGWFHRIAAELERTRESPEVAHTIFDGYLCSAEYLLYGPTPYAEVIGLAGDLAATARRSGAQRAEAFATALLGEAALLSGDLARAAPALEQASALHHAIGSVGGEAHAAQRLAEVRLAEGDRAGARELLDRALPLARRSILARHLLHRVHGTMIVAAGDLEEARAIVDRAEAAMGWDDRCAFCSIMLYVPAAVACARAGDVADARRLLGLARESAALWDGTSWSAAIREAEAEIALAEGDPDGARAGLAAAATSFDRAGQPLDAARCRRAAAAMDAVGPDQAGGANSSSAMPSGSRNASPEP